ncbi:peptidase domain-containing ABC transporter [Pantoea sp. B9002]|uniref:peptidase domain-containing ABC transporter n=1 Tax=Pantoea sp. B9002 TaxID=2726979 RepID=UPI0015A4A645|nr:peptidase domain-containing ABC transporter [Pantoea sp. B9002]NWA62799.1 peptidase domain-containing ABC transporter [Pantoea sp. B9002]
MIKIREKDIIQDEASECGLACLSYITNLFGNGVRLEQLRDEYDVNQDGLSFHHLMRICSDYKMIAKGVKVSSEALHELSRPAILLWNNCHFVVLKKVNKNGIEVMDPAVGSRTFSHQEMMMFFSGFALEITPSSEFSTQNKKDKKKRENTDFYSLSSFRKGLSRYASYLLPLLVFAIIIQLTNIAVPKFLSLVLDEVLPKNDEDFLFLLIYIFSFVYIIQTISSYLKIVISQRLRRVISQMEGVNSIQKLFKMDLKYFNKRMPSDILRKIKSIDVFHVIYTHGWIDIAVEIFFAAVFMMLLFLISFELALITVAITGVMVFARVLLVPKIMSHQYSALDSEIRRDNKLLESLDNIVPIKINRSEHKKINDWFSEHADLESSRSSIEKINALIQLSLSTVSHFQTMVIIGYGSWSVLKGDTTVGQLMTFVFYKDYMIGNIQSAVENHVNIRICSVEVKRLMDINPNEEDSKESFKLLASKSHERVNNIALSNVSFGYSNLDKYIVSDVNFSVSQGQKLVITGPSGCGKTTILNLLSGLLRSSEGSVLINGIELQRFGLKQYQDQIAIVSPDDKIISGSVTENIIYESNNIDMQLLDSCIESADLKGVIKSLSAGLNTRLGINGARLSSGQHQRVMLARALYRKPHVILMDEPTSHLDRKSAAEIIKLISELPMICIIVTHDEYLISSFQNKLFLGKVE